MLSSQCLNYLLWTVGLISFHGFAAASTVDSEVVSWDYRSSAGSKITAADGQAGDQFGYSAAICGDYAFIGAPTDVVGDVASGSVYIYKWNGAKWTFSNKVTSDVYMEDNSYFGDSLHCHSNISVVGAYLTSAHHLSGEEVAECGAVYAFHKDAAGRWSLEVALQSRDPVEGEHFGYSVAVYENVVIVGAVGSVEQPTADFYGLVYAYRREMTWDNDDFAYRSDDNGVVEWILEAIIYPTYAMSVGSLFGISVGIEGDVVAVGSPGSHQRKGGVFLYNRTLIYEANHDDDYVPSYKLLRSVVPEDAENREAFGNSLAMADGKLVVGRYLCKSDDWNLFVGAVHVYSVSLAQGLSVELESVLMEPVAEPQEHGFGYRVSASEGTIVVSASGTHDTDDTIYDPTVYIFGLSQNDNSSSTTGSPYVLSGEMGSSPVWSVHAVLRPSDASSSAYGYFGIAIAAGRDGHVFIGDSSAVTSSSVVSGAIFAYKGSAVESPNGSHQNGSQIFALDFKSKLYIGLGASIASVVVIALIMSRWRQNKYEGISDDPDNSSHYDDIDASRGSSELRERLQRGIGYLSTHGKIAGDYRNNKDKVRKWLIIVSHQYVLLMRLCACINVIIQVPFNYAASEYSDVDEENVLDSSGSSEFSDWRFGAKSGSPAKRGGSVQMGAWKSPPVRRTPQQVMATARAVAADPTHPNRDEVAQLIRSLEKEWISDSKFVDALQQLVN
jgi:hypothetical protein